MDSTRKKLVFLMLLGLLGLVGIAYLWHSATSLTQVPLGSDAADYGVFKAAGELHSALRDLEAAELAYSLSGEGKYQEALRETAAALRRTAGEIQSLTNNSSEEETAAGLLKTSVAKRIAFTEQLISIRRQSGRKAAEARALREGADLSQAVAAALSSLEQNAFTTGLLQDRALAGSIRKRVYYVAAAYGAALFLLSLALFTAGREYVRSLKVNRELHDLKERFAQFTDGLRDSAQSLLGPDGTVTSWNGACERLQGFCEGEVLGAHYARFFPEEDVRLGKPDFCLRTAEAEGRFEQVCSRIRKDGSMFQAHTVITPIRGGDSALKGYSVVTRDVTEQKRTEELLKKLSLTVEQAADLVVITDRAGRVEYVNRAVTDVTGYTRDEFIAGGLQLLQIDKKDNSVEREMTDAALAGRTFHAEVKGLRKNEEVLFLDLVVTPIKDGSGTVTHLVFTGSDLTPVKHMREKIDYLATYDALTGLPNRDLFADRLTRELTEGTQSGMPMAVLTIDIDRFKYLNEIYGLEAGSSILKQVADGLSVSVNKGDTVARLGSDEFGVILHDVSRPADAVLFVKMIMKNVPKIVMASGEELAVTLAIGIAMYPADGTDALTLMKNSGTALSMAKQLGRNRYQFYSADMNEEITELVFMERRLCDALQNKEYLLTYQPYYHLSTKKVAGAEALLRWNNEEFGLVSPAKFIPMLEETGMINDVGNWVLKTACRQIKVWTNGKGHLPISVNLSPSQFRHANLAETVENTVREAGIDPKRLTLEITESTFMKDLDFAVSVLRRLKRIGVAISIDDFGTGYSSLSYLKRFPVDMIKIDQSFVKDVATDPDTTSLVTAIISMAHSLNLKAVAEGVETEDQWKILRLLKCDMGQGFFFGAAVPAKEFEQVFAGQQDGEEKKKAGR